MENISFKEEGMKSNKIHMLLGFVCVLALVFGSVSTVTAGENGNFKNHEGTWILPGGISSYLTCTSTGNSSSRSYTCTSNVFISDGTVFPMFWEGIMTGPDTYRERGIGYVNIGDMGYIFVSTVAGRFTDDNTCEYNLISDTYVDLNGDGLPNEGDFFIPGTPDENLTIYRMVSVFPDMPFPDYPPEP
jgi:hypothetical protein